MYHHFKFLFVGIECGQPMMFLFDLDSLQKEVESTNPIELALALAEYIDEWLPDAIAGKATKTAISRGGDEDQNCGIIQRITAEEHRRLKGTTCSLTDIW